MKLIILEIGNNAYTNINHNLSKEKSDLKINLSVCLEIW